MIAYVDSSVILRILFQEPQPIEGWGDWDFAFTSAITRVEGLRGIDRLRIETNISEREIAEKIQAFDAMLNILWEVPPTPMVLLRASQPLPTLVRSLDAIHLATALLWQEHNRKTVDFLTHDKRLASAVLAMGLRARGFR